MDDYNFDYDETGFDERQQVCQGIVYIIRPGDTLYRIAHIYNVTVAAIITANPGLDPNRLFVGQSICIPVTNFCPGGQLYTIQLGDTLYSIAARFGLTVSAILTANPGMNPNIIFVGQQICIPKGQGTCSGGQFYTIRAGDTLYSIAARFGITVNEILASNPGLDPNMLRVGQQICIPRAPFACPGGHIYVVRPGDTLYSIAARFAITINEILIANPSLNPNLLYVGQQICIPRTPSVCVGGQVYVIQAGDTFFSIARRFGVTVEDLTTANPGINPNTLTIGQQICIPRR